MPQDTGYYYCEVSLVSGTNLVGSAPANSNPTSTGNYVYGLSNGSVVGLLFNSANGDLQVYVDGVYSTTADGGTGDAVFASSPAGGNTGNVVFNFGQQPFLYATNNNNGTATADGQICQLLFDPITEQIGGTFYYDENTHRAISAVEMSNKYGLINRADNKRGIYELTEQPTYPVSHFVKDGLNKYKPVRDYKSLALNLFDVIKAAVTTWAAGTTYANKQLVTNGGVIYQANAEHTSSSAFATDHLKWDVVDLTHGQFRGASNPSSTITPSFGGSTTSASYSSASSGSSYTSSAPPSTAALTKTVTVQHYYGNKYYINGTRQAVVSLTEGNTYKFDQSDSSNAGHPLKFSTTSNGTHASGTEYTTGVTYVGTPGNPGAYTQIVVASGAPTLYYYCSNHSGMGGTVNTPA